MDEHDRQAVMKHAKPAAKTAAKTATKQAKHPARKAAAAAALQAAKQAARTAGKTADTDASVEAAAKKAARKAAKKAIAEVVSEPARKAAVAAIVKAGKKTKHAKEVANKVAAEVAKKMARKTAKKIGENAAKKAAKTALSARGEEANRVAELPAKKNNDKDKKDKTAETVSVSKPLANKKAKKNKTAETGITSDPTASKKAEKVKTAEAVSISEPLANKKAKKDKKASSSDAVEAPSSGWEAVDTKVLSKALGGQDRTEKFLKLLGGHRGDAAAAAKRALGSKVVGKMGDDGSRFLNFFSGSTTQTSARLMRPSRSRPRRRCSSSLRRHGRRTLTRTTTTRGIGWHSLAEAWIAVWIMDTDNVFG